MGNVVRPSQWFSYKNGLIVVRVNLRENTIEVVGRDFPNLDTAEACMENADGSDDRSEAIVLFDMERMEVIGMKSHGNLRIDD